MEEAMQTITLPHSVVQDLKETAWQIDLSVPELLSLIVSEATYKSLDAAYAQTSELAVPQKKL